jgi:alpha-1,6-mannosyltransferase
MTEAPHSGLGMSMTRRPIYVLVTLGVAMCAFVALSPWIIRTYGFSVHTPLMAVSGVITIAATRVVQRVPMRIGMLIIFVSAVVMRLLLVGEQPYLSTDIYRYVWDGRVQAAGINPYRYVPADPALAALRDEAIFPNINRADYAVTAYPPVAQMFFLLATRLSESIVAMRLAMVACEIVIAAVMMDLLRRLRLPPAAVVAWAWHPLAVWEIANSGHVEVVMVALLMVGVWLLVRHRALAGAMAVTLAALVKPYALVALPAFWRPWDWRLPAAVVATLAACYLPYIGVGRGVFGFVTTGYLSEEGQAEGHGFWLVALARGLIGDIPGLKWLYLVAAAVVLGVLALKIAFRPAQSPQQTLTDVATLVLAGLFFLSPNYQWYFLAVVPFVVLGGGIPAWILSLTTILLNRPIVLPYNDLTWKTLALLPFVIAFAACHWLPARRVAQLREILPWTR